MTPLVLAPGTVQELLATPPGGPAAGPDESADFADTLRQYDGTPEPRTSRNRPATPPGPGNDAAATTEPKTGSTAGSTAGSKTAEWPAASRQPAAETDPAPGTAAATDVRRASGMPARRPGDSDGDSEKRPASRQRPPAREETDVSPLAVAAGPDAPALPRAATGPRATSSGTPSKPGMANAAAVAAGAGGTATIPPGDAPAQADADPATPPAAVMPASQAAATALPGPALETRLAADQPLASAIRGGPNGGRTGSERLPGAAGRTAVRDASPADGRDPVSRTLHQTTTLPAKPAASTETGLDERLPLAVDDRLARAAGLPAASGEDGEAGGWAGGIGTTLHASSLAAPRLATLPVMAPAYSAGFAQALGEQLGIALRADLGRAELTLSPAELGPVRVELSLDGDLARVHFAAPHAETRQLLEQSLPHLRTLLAEQGISLGDAQVGPGSQQRDERPAEHWPTTRTAAPREGVPASSAIRATGPPGRLEGLVDLFA